MSYIYFPLANNSGRQPIMVTDLFPHKTQSSLVFNPIAKGPLSLYVHNRAVNEAITTAVNGDGDVLVEQDFAGLGAYLLATIEGSDGGVLADAEITTITSAIFARLDAGLSITQTDVNTIIDGVDAGAGIGEGDSIADIEEIVQIATGYKVFTLPANTIVREVADFDDANLAVLVPNQITDPADVASLYTEFSDSFMVSARSGQLRTARVSVSANGTPTPLVVCLNADGSLIQ